MKKQSILLALMITLLNACHSTPTHHDDTVLPVDNTLPAQLNLPISAQKWLTWQCRDGSQIQTRYQNNDGTQLKLRIQGHEQILSRQASNRPAIYENNQLAFFSDGKTAIIGQPQSNIIYHTGCQPR